EWKLICLTQNILKFSADMRARTLSLTLTAIAPVIDLLGVFRQFLILPSVPRRILNQATASILLPNYIFLFTVSGVL
ncbi:MAG: hypothetical protein MUO95_00885, partial [Methanoregula sp.]|nr:hypothetical protein [Methanoregula sp.]